MKAAVLRGYGQPIEFVEDAQDPSTEIGPDEVLVQVHAAGVNPAEFKIARGDMSAFMPVKFPVILGCDYSGVVIAVGSQVSDPKPGDEVFGTLLATDVLSSGLGSYAEYVLSHFDVEI